jgi:predicted kinase
MPDLKLVVFAGLPGTGKSSLARVVARELSAVYFDKDTIKDAAVNLARDMKIERGNELAGALSYDLLIPLARDNLTLGLSVVLDSPAGYRAFQDKVDGLARDTKADLRVIECICTDETSLRQRLERREDMPDYRTRDWEGYQQARARLEKVTGPRLVVDTAEPLQVNVRKVLAYVGAPPVTD